MRTALIPFALLVACKGGPTPVEFTDDDGDGYTTESDCDDSNASVNPGMTDLAHDDVDADCDGEDGAEAFLYDLPLTVTGPTEGDDFGTGFAICDLTGDGQDDLVIGRGGFTGGARLHVFAGPVGEGDLSTINSDLEIDFEGELTGVLFCADMDGDGNDDLVAERKSRGGVGAGVGVLYQPAGGFSEGITAFDATIDVPSALDEYFAYLTVGDFDGDGKADAVWGRGLGSDDLPMLYWIPGNTYTGELLAEDVGVVVASDFANTYYLQNVGDIDGDGDDDLNACGQASPNCSIVDHLGGGDLAAATLHTLGQLEIGPLAAGDYDGDGSQDDLAYKANGSLFSVIIDAFDQVEIPTVPPNARQVTVNVGDGLGMVENVGDVDGDGIDDIALTMAAFEEDNAGFRVISGALASDPPGQNGNQVTLLRAKNPGSVSVWTAHGDLDGDGTSDVLFGGAALETEGTLGGWLSSLFGG